MPVSDTSIPRAKELFDLNVWALVAVSQAFLPLLIRSQGLPPDRQPHLAGVDSCRAIRVGVRRLESRRGNVLGGHAARAGGFRHHCRGPEDRLVNSN